MFWHGLTWKDRKSVRMIPEDQKVCIDRVRSQMNHAVWEFSQIPQILNMFYECGR